MPSQVRRKLTTILAADAEAYSRAMEHDEVSTFEALRAAREIFNKFIERHEGRLVNTAGDGLIAEFLSVVEAVQCAIEVQQELRGSSNSLRFRIGIHLGDVMIDGTDLLGEGVNLAARLQSMAEPGGILISKPVFDQVQHKLQIGFDYLGEKRPKNFAEDVEVYRLQMGQSATFSAKSMFETKKSSKTPNKPVLQKSLKNQAVHLGIILAGLLVIDLATGDGFWAHWPGLAMVTLFGLKAAPRHTQSLLDAQTARGLVLIGMLIMINLFTWTGYPWALWPIGALLAIGFLKRSLFGSSA